MKFFSKSIVLCAFSFALVDNSSASLIQQPDIATFSVRSVTYSDQGKEFTCDVSKASSADFMNEDFVNAQKEWNIKLCLIFKYSYLLNNTLSGLLKKSKNINTALENMSSMMEQYLENNKEEFSTKGIDSLGYAFDDALRMSVNPQYKIATLIYDTRPQNLKARTYRDFWGDGIKHEYFSHGKFGEAMYIGNPRNFERIDLRVVSINFQQLASFISSILKEEDTSNYAVSNGLIDEIRSFFYSELFQKNGVETPVQQYDYSILINPNNQIFNPLSYCPYINKIQKSGLILLQGHIYSSGNLPFSIQATSYLDNKMKYILLNMSPNIKSVIEHADETFIDQILRRVTYCNKSIGIFVDICIPINMFMTIDGLESKILLDENQQNLARQYISDFLTKNINEVQNLELVVKTLNKRSNILKLTLPRDESIAVKKADKSNENKESEIKEEKDEKIKQPIIEEKENSEINKSLEEETEFLLMKKFAELDERGVCAETLQKILDKVKERLNSIKSTSDITEVIDAAVNEVVGKIEQKKEEKPALQRRKKPGTSTKKAVDNPSSMNTLQMSYTEQEKEQKQEK